MARTADTANTPRRPGTPQLDEAVSTPASVSAGFADPGPLGLAAFAATTFFLSTVNAGLLPATVEAGVFGLAFFYGGLAQVLAGMWEFVKGNTFGAVAFTSYGAFWLSFWYLANNLPDAPAADVSHAVATYLLVWTIFTAYMFIASIRTSGALVAVFAALTLTFAFLTIGDYSGATTWTRVGGWLGLLTAVLAWYASFAGVLNSTSKRVVLPTFPRS